MSHRARRPQRSTSLRATVVASVVAGGVLAAPAATAFASDAPPKPKPTASKPDVVEKKRAAEEAARDAKQKAPSVTPPRGGVAAGDKPAAPEAAPKPKVVGDEARKRAAQAPEGGVAAGERPESGSDGTATLIGSAAGIALLAGASTLVLRRRATARQQA
ncbi:hypothetical protein [Streptomyces flavofungini]|uniref:Gram-positive cocci surface proteins LPxTG domain-containing protein n=1 Tax=Streptomyces flavofungini TaxID=68200 RepID=A0ABS0XFD7_9ACTN|nr:hypothetical protein [Streptomyces flavofungini]MBJ3810324.1 hypothetical protein [Streptomyces flavofungini]MBJ3811948.1 hypothetical protein [Streptomyces flavofungini]GHC50934.1 hypothetical protein GCM10010349_15850 [Streptomyces flavofungini]